MKKPNEKPPKPTWEIQGKGRPLDTAIEALARLLIARVHRKELQSTKGTP